MSKAYHVMVGMQVRDKDCTKLLQNADDVCTAEVTV